MAVVSMTFDTVEKTLAVTVDGKAVADVVEVSAMQYYGEGKFGCDIVTMSKDEDNDTRLYTRLCASDSTVGQAVIARQGTEARSPVEGFVVASEDDKIMAAIAAHFAR